MMHDQAPHVHCPRHSPLRCNHLRRAVLTLLACIASCSGLWAQSFEYRIVGNSVALTRYYGAGPVVEVPETLFGRQVFELGANLFANRSDLTRIDLPRHLANIDSTVFLGCSSLTAIHVDRQNTRFSSVDGVLIRTFDKSVVKCPAAKAGHLFLPDGIQSIDEGAFAACHALTGVTVSASVIRIPETTFGDCSQLASIAVDPASTAYTSREGVLMTRSYRLLTYPAARSGTLFISTDVTEIAPTAFAICPHLSRIDVAPNHPTFRSVDGVLVDRNGFLIRCPGGKAGSFTVPASVNSLRTGAFAGCWKLTRIDTDPGHDEFSSFDGLLYAHRDPLYLLHCPAGRSGPVTVAPSTYGIAGEAFAGCTQITSLNLGPVAPEHLYASQLFADCTSLAWVDVAVENPGFSSRDGLLYDKEMTWLYWCPHARTGTVTLAETTTIIEETAFRGAALITRLELGPHFSSLGGAFGLSYTFDNCTRLAHIEVDAANPVFSSIDGVVYDKSASMLVRCPPDKAGELILPASVTAIWYESFYACPRIERLVLGEGVTSLMGGGLGGLTGLTSLYINQNLELPAEYILPEELRDSPRLATVDIHPLHPLLSSDGGVVYNKDQTTLLWCPPGKLGEVILPDTVRDFWLGSCRDCTQLTRVILGRDFLLPEWHELLYIFEDSPLLADVGVALSNPLLSGLEGVLYDKAQTRLLWCPPGQTAVVLPDTVSSLEEAAFVACPGLTSLSIGQSLVVPTDVFIRWWFSDSPLLAAIDVHPLNPTASSVNGVVYDKAQTTLLWCPPGMVGEVVLPDSVLSVAPEAFLNCSQVRRVVLGANVTTLGEAAFVACPGLTSLSIGQSLVVPTDAFIRWWFSDSPLLAAIDVHPLNPTASSVNGVVYDKAQTTLLWCPPGMVGEVVLPDSVLSVAPEAFLNCSQVRRVVLGANVTTLGEAAFVACPGLTSLSIGQSLVVPTDAFIRWWFSDSPLLAAIDVHPLNPTASSVNGVVYDKAQTTLLWCPPGMVGEVVLPDSVLSVAPEAFYNCSQVRRVVLGANVTTLGEGAFSGCTGLTSLVFGQGLVVPTDAFIRWWFSDSPLLAAIDVHPLNPTASSVNGVVYDKAQTTLLWCPPGMVGEVVLPDSVLSLALEAFYNCSQVRRVILGANVTTLEVGAFSGCTGLTSLVFGQGLVVPTDAFIRWWFSDSPLLAAIDVHPLNPTASSINGVVYDKAQTTLLWCPPGMVGEVVLPDSVLSVAPEAFYNCSQVRRVVLGANVTTLGEGAFSGCTGLTSLLIGQSLSLPPGELMPLIFENSPQLAAIEVHPLNPSFSSIEGVLYNKTQSSLLWWPPAWQGAMNIPATVTAIESFGWPLSTGVSAFYFQGNAPATEWTFPEGSGVLVYYLPETSGWRPTFAGLPTSPREPAVAADSVHRDPVTGEFSFTILWEGNRQVVVEASPNLNASDWVPLGTVDLDHGIGSFSDAESPAETVRFYRVRQP